MATLEHIVASHVAFTISLIGYDGPGNARIDVLQACIITILLSQDVPHECCGLRCVDVAPNVFESQVHQVSAIRKLVDGAGSPC